jgi:hypothetical protein
MLSEATELTGLAPVADCEREYCKLGRPLMAARRGVNLSVLTQLWKVGE